MTVTGGSALPKDDIDRMMREAEQYAEEDHKRREAAETRNQAEQLVYQTEKFLEDNEDKVPGDVKTEVEAAIAELKETLKGEDTAAIREATEKVAADQPEARPGAVRQQRRPPVRRPAAPHGDGGAGAGAGGGDDDVVDAEIVDEEQGHA